MRLLTLLAASIALCEVAQAQDWRTLDVARQVRDSQPVTADITYGAGSFSLGPAQGTDLYDMRIRYGAGNTTPVATYDPTTHKLRLGINSKTFAIPGGDVDQNDLHIGLARGVPVDLTTEVGAADVKMDLGGLSIDELHLKTGASDATITFSSPNAVKMRSMMFEVGAAGFKATGLANARADHIMLHAGIGSWDLYFDGNWTGDITLDAKIGLGSLTIHVPDDVRVEQNANAMLGAVTGDHNRGDHNRGMSDTSANDNDADTSSMDDDDDDSSDSSSATVAKTKAAAHAAARAARIAAADARAQAAMARAQAAEARAGTARYTLHIVGSATLGQISFDHKLAGADGQ
jgi:hypothetical protein